MDRRIVPSMIDHAGRPGAMATRWESRWPNPRNRTFDYTTINISHWSRIHSIEDRVGCFAMLYRPSTAAKPYVAYIGFSRIIGTEVRKKYRDFEVSGSSFPFAAILMANAKIAAAYEDDLIRYYAPPWNTKFHKQGV